MSATAATLPGLLRVAARDLRRHDVTLGSKQRVIRAENGGTGKMLLTLERMAGRNAGTLRVAEWNRGTIIGIFRPDDCPHCDGFGVKPRTVGAGCGHCEHGRTPPPFRVSSVAP